VDDRLDFSPSALEASVNGSLERLDTSYIDVLFLHNPPDEYLAAHHPIYEALQRLVDAGKVRFCGVSLDFAREMRVALDNPGCRVIEVMFNAFHQEPLVEFAKAEARGVGLVVKVPLDSGWLSGRYDRASQFSDIRRRWTRETIERRYRYLDALSFLREDGKSMVEAALGFVLGHDSVSTVIPGAKSLAQLEENFGAAATPLSQEALERAHALYQGSFARDPLPW
jgi:aryl-alcohol dehydrogenase-like predicted oxidoreductase